MIADFESDILCNSFYFKKNKPNAMNDKMIIAAGVMALPAVIGASSVLAMRTGGCASTPSIEPFETQAKCVAEQGATGPTGRIGVFTGTMGVTGATGFSGARGPSGMPGPTGVVGATGPLNMGATGSVGMDGAQGMIGTQGATGLIGMTGQTGYVGMMAPQPGVIGSDGAQGTMGVTGGRGSDGVIGTRGATGPTGPIGVTGSMSNPAPGPPGSIGVSGTTGATGPGLVGLTGPNGVRGPQGPDGGVGSTGPTGFDGVEGERGITGVVGVTGTTGVVGITGSLGVTGSIGGTGSIGVTGPVGSGLHTSNVAHVITTNTAAFNLAANTWYPCVIPTESVNVGITTTDNSTRFVSTIGGTFLLSGTVFFAQTLSDTDICDRSVFFTTTSYVDGVNLRIANVTTSRPGNDNVVVSTSTVLYISANTPVSMIAHHTRTGGDVRINGLADERTRFSMTLLAEH
jgi:hypothetical protein